MLIHRHRYVDRWGVTHFMLDRTQGLPFLTDTVCRFFKDIRLKAESIVKSVLPRQNATGTYIYRNGKCIKISSEGKVGDIWIKHHGVTADQGDKELHNFFCSQDKKGKLYEIDDREVWEPLRKRYGRDPVKLI